MGKLSYSAETVKKAVRIEEVIGRYVRLVQKSGGSSMGLCPFHPDKNPSFSVHHGKQFYQCFSCHEAGDVIRFVQEIEGCSFTEALEKLALHAGIAPQSQPSPATDPAAPVESGSGLGFHTPHWVEEVVLTENERKDAIYRNERFLKSLYGHMSPIKGMVYAYVDFEVGMSGGYQSPEFKAMKNRIVFPIRDRQGVLVGFSARKMGEGPCTEGYSPKYINTKSNGLFKKSELLYGLHLAETSILNEGMVWVTEGLKDAIAMYAAGYRNAVALMGCDMSDFQCSLIAGLCRRVILLLDPDEAGMRGAAKAAAKLKAVGVHVMVMQLPDGEDPDSLFRKHGKEGLRAILRECPDAASAKADSSQVTTSEFVSSETNLKESVPDDTALIPLGAGADRPRLMETESELIGRITSLRTQLFVDTTDAGSVALQSELMDTCRRLREISKQLNRPGTVLGFSASG